MTCISDKSFDGKQPRPYTFQTFGTPRAQAKSGTRSVHAWQRDYNTKGVTHEQFATARQERVRLSREKCEKEAKWRGVPVEQVEEEMSSRSYAEIRVPSHIVYRKAEAKNKGDVELITRSRGQDGQVKIDTTYDLIQAREMFRGEEWDAMEQALSNINADWRVKPTARCQLKPAENEEDVFRPPARNAKSSPPASGGGGGATKRNMMVRGSFSAGVSAAALAQQLQGTIK